MGGRRAKGAKKGRRSPATLWQQARDALHAAGVENYTRTFGEVACREGWGVAHGMAALKALEAARPLWVDLDDVDVAPYKACLLALLPLLQLDENMYKAVYSRALAGNVVPEYEAFARTAADNGARVLLFFKDVSCVLEPRALLHDLPGRIEREAVGVGHKVCGVCHEDCRCLFHAVYSCTHGYCEACCVQLEKKEFNVCPLCRAPRPAEAAPTTVVDVGLEIARLKAALLEPPPV